MSKKNYKRADRTRRLNAAQRAKIKKQNTLKLFLFFIFLGVIVVSLVFLFKTLLVSSEESDLSNLGSAKIHSFADGDDYDAETYGSYIFVGDSRYKGMREFADDNDIFICESGVGINHLKENYDYIVDIADSDTAIIVGLGVNDLNNVQEYIKLLEKLADDTKASVYYMTVNPVDDDVISGTGYSIRTPDIRTFNSTLASEISDNITIIDTYSHLKKTGFKTEDGLHYDNNTYKKIYNFIKNNL